MLITTAFSASKLSKMGYRNENSSDFTNVFKIILIKTPKVIFI